MTLLLFFLFSNGIVQSGHDFMQDNFKASKVGVLSRDYADSSRSNWPGTGPRPVRSVVWYPAGRGGAPEILNSPSQFIEKTTLFRDARISPSKKKYPMVIISHGSQGSSGQMRWLGVYLASRGYICVAVDHNGTDTEERKTGILTLSDACMWERPRDLSSVLDKILKDPLFGVRIDTSRIAGAGFSLGGATVIWIAGAVFNADELGRNEPEPPPIFKADIDRLKSLKDTDPIIINSMKHSADSFRDARIKAVFALSPAIGQGFPSEGLKKISVPVQIVVGDADLVAPMERNAVYYAKNIPSARPLIVLPGERGHYLKSIEPEKQATELLEVSQLAFHFFEEVLKQDQ